MGSLHGVTERERHKVRASERIKNRENDNPILKLDLGASPAEFAAARGEASVLREVLQKAGYYSDVHHHSRARQLQRSRGPLQSPRALSVSHRALCPPGHCVPPGPSPATITTPARPRRWPGDRDVTAATRAPLTNQRAPEAQLGDPIGRPATRCVTGHAPRAVANGRAPRPVRADVAERTERRRAPARGFPFPPARARGGRGRERAEGARAGARGGGTGGTGPGARRDSRSAPPGSARRGQRPLPSLPPRRRGSGPARARP
ncbi:translation initiation factor IF-2-like [Myiozetetes cayanensis]|uniref:translation initiation factor IF-2-like n=1 Tax=Myiozetetes cayanensis TaxID=478635 RepID=UPI00215F40CB|nr:translation initiation factor IF-2-like [Myiozetetes cayanensis]